MSAALYDSPCPGQGQGQGHGQDKRNRLPSGATRQVMFKRGATKT